VLLVWKNISAVLTRSLMSLLCPASPSSTKPPIQPTQPLLLNETLAWSLISPPSGCIFKYVSLSEPFTITSPEEEEIIELPNEELPVHIGRYVAVPLPVIR